MMILGGARCCLLACALVDATTSFAPGRAAASPPGRASSLAAAKAAAPSFLPAFLQRRWRRALGCDVCEDARRTPCPNCDGEGGYVAQGGVAVSCKACRGTGRVVCRACFTGDGYDIEQIRRDMGYPD